MARARFAALSLAAICAMGLVSGCSGGTSAPGSADTAPGASTAITKPEALALADSLTQRAQLVLSINDQARWKGISAELTDIATQQASAAEGLRIRSAAGSSTDRLVYPVFEVSAESEPTWCVSVPIEAVKTSLRGSLAGFSYSAQQGDCSAVVAEQEQVTGDHRSEALAAVAAAAGTEMSRGISGLLLAATDMGDSPQSDTTWATLQGSTLTLAFSGRPVGVPRASSAQVSVPAGVKVVASGHAPGRVTAAGPTWCIAVAYQDALVVFAQSGERETATKCAADGSVS